MNWTLNKTNKCFSLKQNPERGVPHEKWFFSHCSYSSGEFFLTPMSHTWKTQPLNVNMCNHIQNKVEFFIGVIMSAADAKDDDIN